MSTIQARRSTVGTRQAIPPLVAGDRLTRTEFERRYEAMPHLHKAELIEGVVYMPSPLTAEWHRDNHSRLSGWLSYYEAFTPGVRASINASVRMDNKNEPQPDASLRILPDWGGQSRIEDGYIKGAAELHAEVAFTIVALDGKKKRTAYQRNGVKEYIVWRVQDAALDWFVLRHGRYVNLPVSADGLYKSKAFPGLWLDPAALAAGEMARVLKVLEQGLASAEHARFCSRLETARSSRARQK